MLKKKINLNKDWRPDEVIVLVMVLGFAISEIIKALR